jgi:predicted nucleic acid-binding protein
MIAYFDTSALVKLVVQEEGSEHAERVWQEASTVVSNVLLYPEARAALKRARRDRRLRDAELRLAVRGVERLWAQVERILVSVPLAVRAGELAHAFDLRGYDAVHLAAAETLAAAPVVLVCADGSLCDAAAAVGLAVARVAH